MYTSNSLLTQHFVGGDACSCPKVGRKPVGARMGMCPLYRKWNSENEKENAVPCHSSVHELHVTTLIVLVIPIGQLRKVAACEAALERIVLEANEALGTLTFLGRTTSDQVMLL